MEIEVVGHDRGANDADGHVEHTGLAQRGQHHRAAHFQEARLSLREDEELDEVADTDCGDQDGDDGFDHPHPKPLEGQQQQHVTGRDHHRPE